MNKRNRRKDMSRARKTWDSHPGTQITPDSKKDVLEDILDLEVQNEIESYKNGE
jgi:hypothetical protein